MKYLIIIFLSSPFFFAGHKSATAQVYKTINYDLKLTVVADGLNHPWGMAFLPEGKILVTERNIGTIRIVEKDGTLWPPIMGLPRTYTSGQGGMLDVAIDPEFKTSKLIYFSYAEPGIDGAGIAVARGRFNLHQNSLSNMEVIFRQFPKTKGGLHFGSRLVFSSEKHLYITVGERGESERPWVLRDGLGAVLWRTDMPSKATAGDLIVRMKVAP